MSSLAETSDPCIWQDGMTMTIVTARAHINNSAGLGRQCLPGVLASLIGFIALVPAHGAPTQKKVPVFTYVGAPAIQLDTADDDSFGAKYIPEAPGGSSEAFLLGTFGEERRETGAEWTATINMTGDGVGCTGTMIGPKVLLTAAHCVERWRVIGLALMAEDDRVSIDANCTVHPMYRSAGYFNTFDYALCHLDKPYPENLTYNRGTTEVPAWDVAATRLERISLDEHHRQPGGNILLAGFGCSSKRSKTIDGNLRAGIVPVTGVSRLLLRAGGRSSGPRGVICEGDSGGAAYRYSTGNPYGPRVIVGINSGNYLQRGISVLVRTSAPVFKRFLNSWRTKWRNPKICGLDKEIDHLCHS